MLENHEEISEQIVRKIFKRFQRFGELKKQSNFEVKKILQERLSSLNNKIL